MEVIIVVVKELVCFSLIDEAERIQNTKGPTRTIFLRIFPRQTIFIRNSNEKPSKNALLQTTSLCSFVYEARKPQYCKIYQSFINVF